MFIIIRNINERYNQDYNGDDVDGPDEPIYVTADKAKAEKFVSESNNNSRSLREKIKKWNTEMDTLKNQYHDKKYPNTYKELINFNNSELGIKFIHEYCENPKAYALMADKFNSELKRVLYKDLGEDPSKENTNYIYDFAIEEIPEL
jgi:hypothetical protein